MAKQKGKTEREMGTAKAGDMGETNIAEEVLSLVAYKATIDVKGVASMTGGIITDLAALVRKGETPRGVRIAKADDEVKVDVSVEVEYGEDMTRIASDIQKAVAKALKDMAGITPAAVNVNIAGIHLNKPEEQEKEASPEAEA